MDGQHPHPHRMDSLASHRFVCCVSIVAMVSTMAGAFALRSESTPEAVYAQTDASNGVRFAGQNQLQARTRLEHNTSQLCPGPFSFLFPREHGLPGSLETCERLYQGLWKAESSSDAESKRVPPVALFEHEGTPNPTPLSGHQNFNQEP